MQLHRAHSLAYVAVVAASIGMVAASCNPSPKHAALPFHDDALVHQSRLPYQQASAAQVSDGASTSASKRPATKAPTPPRKTAKGTDTPSTTVPDNGVVPTTVDNSKGRARNADGYQPRNALRYVLDTYAMNGLRFDNAEALGIVDLHRAIQKSGTIYHTERPVVGDLVFFHNTHDANGDRRNNDWYVHVGVIESVGKDNTIVFLSYRNNVVTRDRMNIEHSHDEKIDGQRVNSVLRTPQKNDPAYTQYLAAELFAGFGSILGDRGRVRIMNAWKP